MLGGKYLLNLDFESIKMFVSSIFLFLFLKVKFEPESKPLWVIF